MRCHICDAALTDEEVRWNRQHKDFDPCGVCREVIANVFGEEDDDDLLNQRDDVIIDEELDEVTNYNG